MYVSTLMQGVALVRPPVALDGVAGEVAAVGGLGAFAVLVYRLGVWREELRHGVRELGVQLGRVEAELQRVAQTLEQFMAETRQQHVTSQRWQGGVDKTLELHSRQIHGVQAFNQPEAS